MPRSKYFFGAKSKLGKHNGLSITISNSVRRAPEFQPWLFCDAQSARDPQRNILGNSGTHPSLVPLISAEPY